MEHSKKYKPISCVYYDFIEHYATRKEIVNITMKGKGAHPVELKSRILDTKTEGQIEYLLLDETKEWIRMDHIISLNEHKLSDYQDC